MRRLWLAVILLAVAGLSACAGGPGTCQPDTVRGGTGIDTGRSNYSLPPERMRGRR